MGIFCGEIYFPHNNFGSPTAVGFSVCILGLCGNFYCRISAYPPPPWLRDLLLLILAVKSFGSSLRRHRRSNFRVFGQMHHPPGYMGNFGSVLEFSKPLGAFWGQFHGEMGPDHRFFESRSVMGFLSRILGDFYRQMALDTRTPKKRSGVSHFWRFEPESPHFRDPKGEI